MHVVGAMGNFIPIGISQVFVRRERVEGFSVVMGSHFFEDTLSREGFVFQLYLFFIFRCLVNQMPLRPPMNGGVFALFNFFFLRIQGSFAKSRANSD